LSLILALFGTPYCPSFKDSILYFEEVDEQPYTVDRYLSTLRNAGIFDEIKGLIVGSMTDCTEGKTQPSLTLEQVFGDYFKEIKVPIIDNLIYGHIPRKNTMPFGIKAQMDTETKEIEILEGCVI
jgi:muramoyltetrapeptide carboxypeptidase